MSEILTSSACMLSCVMAMHNTLPICMLYGLVSGQFVSLRPWIGEGLAEGTDRGGPISLKACYGHMSGDMQFGPAHSAKVRAEG